MKVKRIYYVYLLLDPRKPGEYSYGEYKFTHEPFYVGKGQDNRVNHDKHCYYIESLGKRVHTTFKSISGHEPIRVKVSVGLTELMAFTLEKKLIKRIGRRELGHGPLWNVTNGGPGASGSCSPKERVENGTHHFVTNHPMKNPENRKSVAERMLGSVINCKEWLLTHPCGSIDRIVNLKKICKQYGLDYSFLMAGKSDRGFSAKLAPPSRGRRRHNTPASLSTVSSTSRGGAGGGA